TESLPDARYLQRAPEWCLKRTSDTRPTHRACGGKLVFNKFDEIRGRHIRFPCAGERRQRQEPEPLAQLGREECRLTVGQLASSRNVPKAFSPQYRCAVPAGDRAHLAEGD